MNEGKIRDQNAKESLKDFYHLVESGPDVGEFCEGM
jgi:hypothetical protein